MALQQPVITERVYGLCDQRRIAVLGAQRDAAGMALGALAVVDAGQVEHVALLPVGDRAILLSRRVPRVCDRRVLQEIADERERTVSARARVHDIRRLDTRDLIQDHHIKTPLKQRGPHRQRRQRARYDRGLSEQPCAFAREIVTQPRLLTLNLLELLSSTATRSFRASRSAIRSSQPSRRAVASSASGSETLAAIS